MKVIVIIERGIDGTYSAYIEDNNLPFAVIGDGNTVSETIDDFHIALKEMEAYYEKAGKEFPHDLQFAYRFDTASFLQHYAYAFTLAGLERITGINQRQLSHYINGIRKPSKKTIEKIERRLHDFGNEISAVRLV